MILSNIKQFFGADEYESMSTKQIQRQVALNTLQAQKIELDKKETASTIALTQADRAELVTQQGIIGETLVELQSRLGLIEAENGDWVMTNKLTEAKIRAEIAELNCSKADKQHIITELEKIGVLKKQITLQTTLNKLKEFAANHPLMTMGIAVAGIAAGVIALHDAFTTSADEVEKAYDEYKQVESELKSLQDELETTKSRIDELNTQQNLTLVEAEELENLKETNRQLEFEIRNREKLARIKGEKANNKAVKYFDGINTWNGSYNTSNTGTMTRLEAFEEALNKIADLKEQQKALGGDIEGVRYKTIQAQIDSYQKFVDELLVKFMDEDDALVDGIDNGIKQQLEELYRLYDITMNDVAQTYTDTINGAFEKVEFVGFKDKLIDLEKNGKLSAQVLATDFEDLVKVLNAAGVSADALYQYIQNLANPDALNYSAIKDQLWASMGVNVRTPGKYTYDTMSMFENRGLLTNEALEAYITVRTKFAGQTDTWTPEDWASHIEEVLSNVDPKVKFSFDNVFALEDANGEANDLGKLSEQIDDLQTAWSGLREMVDNYNKTGTITVDQLQAVLSYGDDYLGYLVDEKGNLQLNEEALKKVAAARIQEMKAKVLSDLYDQVARIENEEQALSFLESKLIDVTTATDNYTEAQFRSLLLTKKALLSEEDYAKFEEGVLNMVKSVNTLFDNISVSSLFGKETDWKDLLDKETALLEKQLEAGLISFEDYANKRKDIIEKYYNDGLITAEQYYSALEDMYDYQLSVYDKILNAVTRRFDKEIESIEKQIEELEKSNELLENQKDDYDKVLSVVSEVYDNEIKRVQEEQDAIQDKIDLLQEENDENQRAINLEKARYELARLQSQRNKKVRHCLLLQ